MWMRLTFDLPPGSWMGTELLLEKHVSMTTVFGWRTEANAS